MTYHSIRNISISASIFLHALILILFLLIKFSFEYPPKEYVELSFGSTGKSGSSGAIGREIENVKEMSKAEEKNETKESKQEEKEVELPKAISAAEDNIVEPADKAKDKASTNKTASKTDNASKITSSGQGNKASGSGSFGFDIDWGGQGKRKIYSYILPAYPEGVNKEIDIRLKFTILPDGTIGTIFPLIKADTRLENAAINSLRQWRFEALDPAQKQIEQTAVIVFPYRLQ